ncbi:hypothetical protein O0L34_g8952 [Tuta absoluta]|nr:hypothetical protein O0L34_g8952 [Tuta absoluta]
MNDKYPKKPRRIIRIKGSKYEASEAIHENKKYWRTVLEKVDAEHRTPKEITQIKHIADVLPDDLCNRVCDTLRIPKSERRSREPEIQKEKSPRRVQKEPFITYRTQLHVDREMESDTDVEYSSSDEEKPNCHWDLLKKPVREQITWATRYLEPEKEDEKSLITKADDVTDRIAKEFCQYMKELGGNQQSQLFTPHAVKELFQVEFNSHIARGLQVVPKEIPAVLEKIALAAESPESSQLAVLEREVSKDIKVETRPEKKVAFGTAMPSKEQWHTPQNNTQKTWRSSRYVPKDLVTMKTVWEGITTLRSVREYCRWMIENPEHRRAPYLRSLGMFDPAVLQARATFDKEISYMRIPEDMKPQPIENLRRRLSQLAESGDQN